MPKSLFFFIAFILGVNCWDLIILESVFNDVTNSVFAVVWASYGFIYYRSRPGNVKIYDFKKYKKYFYWLVLGFSLSVITANIFWGQDFLTGTIVNRLLIWYIYLPLILYIQPSESDIIRALIYYTGIYFIIWAIQAITPYPIFTSLANTIELGRASFELSKTDFGQLLPGYSMILFLLYFKLQKFTENINYKTTIQAFGLLALFFLLQNRGALFFAVIVFGYSLLKLRSQYRLILIIFLGLLVIGTYIFTANYWNGLIQETIVQWNDPDYNRWRSFYFFLFYYSPHWICNILGNGFLSANVPAGQYIQNLMDKGYYQYDNGILGFWSTYGIIPLIVLYSVIFKLLFKKHYPFYVKVMAAHILFIPIAWNFRDSDVFIFVILIYLFAYYSENMEHQIQLSTTNSP